ncbi:MAG: hypothetical protein H0V17_00350 [Deltaproteobacteria bacterium]|nr:hypothetical protein [Deltaproteobacteria bacterium]
MRATLLAVAAIAACSGAKPAATLQSLRPACGPTQYWSGTACTQRGDTTKLVTEAKLAVDAQDPDKATAVFAAADKIRPFDHETNVAIWELRGIVAGFMDQGTDARSAFDMLLALAPGHLISYGLKPAITEIFEAARADSRKRRPPEVDIAWPSGLTTADPIPLDVEVLSDPKQFLRRATVFVRARGDSQWRASDLELAPKPQRVVIPPVRAAKPTAVELYLRAYDERGNEVLAWSDPTRPREIPLRYDPPTKWYRSWKTYAIGGTAAALITGIIVYAVTLSPPDDASGSGVVK